MADDRLPIEKTGVAPFPPATARREPAMTTLNAIGEVSVAADVLSHAAPRRHRRALWIPLVAFAILAYGSGVASAALLLPKARPGQIWLLPLLPALFAIAAFGSRLAWKRRAQIEKARTKIYREAYDAVGFASANAATAARANLLGLRTAASEPARAQHVREIDAGVIRIDEALKRIQQRVKEEDAKQSR